MFLCYCLVILFLFTVIILYSWILRDDALHFFFPPDFSIIFVSSWVHSSSNCELSWLSFFISSPSLCFTVSSEYEATFLPLPSAHSSLYGDFVFASTQFFRAFRAVSGPLLTSHGFHWLLCWEYCRFSHPASGWPGSDPSVRLCLSSPVSQGTWCRGV